MGWLSGLLPGPEDAFGLGLVLVLVGGFLLANSVLLRHPRALVAEHFGAAREALPMPGVPRTREDVPLPSLDRDELLAAASESEDGFFVVPKTVGGER